MLNDKKGGKLKRIVALLGVAVLIFLYILTFIFAITDNPATMSYFKASLVMTIMVPGLLYVYQLVYRVLKNTGNNSSAYEGENDKY